MPEEINRVLTDQISELLFTTERSAEGNLVREGVRPESIHFVGNVMIDTLRHNLERALPAAETLGRPVARGEFGVVTLHRPSNVDDADTLHSLLGVLSEVAGRIPLALPLHPRTRARIEAAGLEHLVKKPEWILLPPQGYLQMLGLMRDAKLVLTDSGGIQEETTALGVPCITLRENTERPVTLSEGTNTLVGRDPEKIRAAVDEIFLTGGKSGRIPEYWDGHAADRIAAVIGAWLTADAGAGKR
jgi:UDP-N-acetylglucosamine 2-epimerase (non-hydrolysing)